MEDMLEKMGGEIAKIAAPNVGGAFDVWKTRALVEVSNRDELKDVLATKTGIFSVYKALTKAATMGLQIGGQFPHAYLVPFQGKAQLVATAEGYAFACAHGPGAVLSNIPKLEHVHENDKLHVDAAAGKVKHDFEPFGERGKLVGYYMRLEYLDGHVEIATIRQNEVDDIEKVYSRSDGPAFKKSPQAMHDKTAAKQLLKKPVKESEGLAMLLAADEYEAPEPRQAPPRDVSERVGGRLDRIAEKAEAVEVEEVEEVAEEAQALF